MEIKQPIKFKKGISERIMNWVVWGNPDGFKGLIKKDLIKFLKTKQAHCPRCGEPILSDEDALCGRCAS